jgi:hypothetical protein
MLSDLVRSIRQHVYWMLFLAVYASIVMPPLDMSDTAANQPMQKSLSAVPIDIVSTTMTSVTPTTEVNEHGDSGHDVLWGSKTIALVIVTVTGLLLSVGAAGIVIYCIRLRINREKSQDATNTQTPSQSPLLSKIQSSSNTSSRTISISTSSSSESSKEANDNREQ